MLIPLVTLSLAECTMPKLPSKIWLLALILIALMLLLLEVVVYAEVLARPTAVSSRDRVDQSLLTPTLLRENAFSTATMIWDISQEIGMTNLETPLDAESITQITTLPFQDKVTASMLALRETTFADHGALSIAI